MLLSCIFVLLLNMYDGGHLASFICPTMLLCLVYHTRVSVPMFIAVSLFFLPFVFFCCTSTPYHKCVPILILFPTFFLLRNNKRGRCNLFTCHSFSLISIFTFLDYNALNHADIF